MKIYEKQVWFGIIALLSCIPLSAHQSGPLKKTNQAAFFHKTKQNKTKQR